MGTIEEKDREPVRKLLKRVLGAASWQTLERLGGLTNHTYRAVLADGREVAVRLPGEGTEAMIVRADERVSTELACRLGVDAPLLYFGDDGSKVSEYIRGAVTMSAETMREPERIGRAAKLLRTVHGCGEETGVPFEVFDMAAGYEAIIRDLSVPMFPDYPEQKAQVMRIKEEIDRTVCPRKVPCHNDPLCENWVEDADGRLYLIDWEYAGMNDGFWDIAAVSIEAGFNGPQDDRLLEAYLERPAAVTDRKHFLAAKIYVDYLWTLWAKTRVPFSGQPMEDWAVERYGRMKENLRAIGAL